MKKVSATRFLALTIAASAALLLPGSAGAATPTPLHANLVKNAGAEAGIASLDGQSSVPIPHWETLNTFTVVEYGTSGGFPTVHEGNRINGHHQFFSAGPFDNGQGDCDDAIQFIKIHGRGGSIDSRHIKVTLSARMATFDSQTDTANVVLSFHDGNNEQLTTPHHGDLSLAPVTASNGKFRLNTASKVLPKGTRTLRITLSASNTEGYCDAYFDNISITLSAV